MARTAFSALVPDGPTQAGTPLATSANANDKALRDNIIAGQMEGFVFSVTAGTGTASEPQYMFWKNGTTWVRATNTWSSTGSTNGDLTQQIWELSTNSGGAYDAIVTTTFSYDGDGNLTATTGGGGMLAWMLSKIAMIKVSFLSVFAHIAATGASVHGLGTISTQSAAAVALTGGTINDTVIGNTGADAATFERASEQFATYTPATNGAVSMSWRYGASVITTDGTNAITFVNVPSAVLATHTVKLSSFTGVTWPAAVTWGASGAPTIGAVAAVVSLFTFDGGTTVYAVLVWNA